MRRLAPLAVAAVMILTALNVLASAATPTAPCDNPSCATDMRAPAFCTDPSCLASASVAPCSDPGCQ